MQQLKIYSINYNKIWESTGFKGKIPKNYKIDFKH